MTNTDNFVYKNEKREYFHLSCYIELKKNKESKNKSYKKPISYPFNMIYYKIDYLLDQTGDDLLTYQEINNFINSKLDS
jgi:hypothetical protein